MRRTKNINVDRKAWEGIRQMFPNTPSDSRRTVLIKNILDEVNLPQKLRTEFSDTRSDKIVKRMLKGIL